MKLHMVAQYTRPKQILKGVIMMEKAMGLSMAGIEWSLPFGAMIRTTVIGPSIILFSSDHLLC